MSLQVAIIPDYKDEAKIDTIRSYFRDYPVEVLSEVPLTDKVTASIADGLYIHQAIQRFPNHSLLIIKSSSITTADSATVKSIVDSLLQNRDADVAYLAKWLDNCAQYTAPVAQTTRGNVYELVSPNGIQALILNRKAIEQIVENRVVQSMDRFLKHQITKGKLAAIGMVPNLFNYDITLDKSQAYRLNECLTQPPVSPAPSPATSPVRAAVPAVAATTAVTATAAAARNTTQANTDSYAQQNIWAWVFIALLIILIITAVVKNRK